MDELFAIDAEARRKAPPPKMQKAAREFLAGSIFFPISC
jgi:hypothetical protein